MADKVTGSFTQSNAVNGYGGASVSSFLRSNGTVFSFRGQTSGLVDNALQILDIVNNTDENLEEFCFNVNDLSAANLSVCNGAGLLSVPSDFGLSAAPRGKMDLTFNQALRTDITTIMTTTDFPARGVGEFKPEITE